jgi:hypothetical protein
LQIEEIDEDEEVKEESPEGDEAPVLSTAVTTRPNSTPWTVKESISKEPRAPAVSTRPFQKPGIVKDAVSLPYNRPRTDIYKTRAGGRSRGQKTRGKPHPLPVFTKPPRENKWDGEGLDDGGEDGPPENKEPTTRKRKRRPPPQGDPGDGISERISSQMTQGDDEIPLRPETVRAGIDTLKWPNKRQKMDKFNEATYYFPKHEFRGTAFDNPLIKQNMLEDMLRFRNTDPFPTKRPEISQPSQQMKERVAMLLQSSYNSANGQLKMNSNTTTSVPLSQPMMNSLYVPTAWTDTYVPASIQAGGAPFTRAGRFHSLY